MLSLVPFAPFADRCGLRVVASNGEVIGYAEIWALGDGGFVVRNHDGGAHCFFASAPYAGVNFIEARGAVSGKPPEVKAIGPSENIPVRLTPKGSSGLTQVRNGIEFLDVQPDGSETSVGFLCLRKVLEGGNSNELVLRMPAGQKLHVLQNATEVATLP